MNDLKDLRRKVADIITESENVPIIAENIMESKGNYRTENR
jgi:hypothetical protein